MSLIDEVKELLQKLEPVFGNRTKALWYLNLFSKDAQTAFSNRDLLQILADKKANIDYKEEIRLPPPDPKKLKGDYNIGQVLYPDQTFAEFGFKEDEFIKHILITGMTGSGKTNLSFKILKELALKNKPFLIFDWKNNYRALRQLKEFKNIRIIKFGDKDRCLKFNPLIPPPHTHAKHWLALIVDIIKHAFFVAHGVEYFFRKGIDYLYEQFGIYKGKTEYPTFSDLEKTLQKEFVRGREILWMSSAKRVLASLTFSGLLGEVLNVRRHDNVKDLLNQQVIIEMDNLATIEKIFLTESLLLWIYHLRKAESKRETFKHAIVIEEAHHVLSGKKEYESGEEPIIESIIRMIREFGQSFIIIDQEPSKISNSILANTNCKISFNLGNGNDISTISKAMNLKYPEQRYIDKLKIGHAILKLKDRFSEPIHMQFPLIPIKKDSIGTP